MKYLKYLFIMLLIPFIVLAEECDISKITITSMEQSSIEGNTEEIEEPTFQDRSINLNLKLYDVGDSITYNMTIKNDSEEDYMIEEDTFKTDSEYIEYTLKAKDNTNVVKAGITKEVTLIVTYKKEVDDNLLTNNKFDASNSLKLSLNTNNKEHPLDIITTDNIKSIKNPPTSIFSIKLFVLILLISLIIIVMGIKNKNKYAKYMFLIMTFIIMSKVYAICKCDIELDANITIEKRFSGTGTIYSIKNYITHISWEQYPVTGEDMSFLEEMKPVFKWCQYSIDDVNKEEGYCIYDTKEVCEQSIGYCSQKSDGSWNSCRDDDFGFANESTCLVAIEDDINNGYASIGEYTCQKDIYSTCDIGSVIEGDYSQNRSMITKKAFYKYRVENYIIKESYICFITDKEYCLQSGENNYESNYQTMKKQEQWFLANNGSCSYDENSLSAYCTGAGYSSITIHDGFDIFLGFLDDSEFGQIGTYYCLFREDSICYS